MYGLHDLYNIDDFPINSKKAKKLYKLKKNGQDIEIALYTFLVLLITQKFSWDNLPEELACRKYIIEYMLYHYGVCLFFKEDGKYYCLPAYQSNTINIYGEATEYRAYGLNGFDFGVKNIREKLLGDLNETSEPQNAVLIRNNQLSQPQQLYNKALINRLIYIWQTLGIQNGLSRVKALIFANKSVSDKVNDVITNMINDPSLTVTVPTEMSENLSNDTEKHDFGGNYDPQSCWYDFDKTLSTLLSLNGIQHNAEPNKRVEQTAAEVQSNDFLTAYSNNTRKEMREIAIKDINSLFNLNIVLTDNTKKELEEERERQAALYGGGVKKENTDSENDFKNGGS